MGQGQWNGRQLCSSARAAASGGRGRGWGLDSRHPDTPSAHPRKCCSGGHPTGERLCPTPRPLPRERHPGTGRPHRWGPDRGTDRAHFPEGKLRLGEVGRCGPRQHRRSGCGDLGPPLTSSVGRELQPPFPARFLEPARGQSPGWRGACRPHPHEAGERGPPRSRAAAYAWTWASGHGRVTSPSRGHDRSPAAAPATPGSWSHQAQAGVPSSCLECQSVPRGAVRGGCQGRRWPLGSRLKMDILFVTIKTSDFSFINF